jgi:hypothetical protein
MEEHALGPDLACSRFLIALFMLYACAGCGGAVPSEAPTSIKPALQSHFDPENAGSVQGSVSWRGDPPLVPQIEGWLNPAVENGPRQKQVRPNPNAPQIDPETHGLQNAIVFLEGVSAETGRPWDLPRVRVVQRDFEFHVLQGGVDSQVGFVRRGDPIEMLSADHAFHALQADGAVFFCLMFPDPNAPLTRKLERAGLVELASAAGYTWMRAYLFVEESPYYCRVDNRGHFQLTGVPAGDYELACWVPNWIEDRHERDPETALIIRQFFLPPVKKTLHVSIPPGRTIEASCEFSSADFERPKTASGR